MAGENVPERVVRKVFSSSIDLVIHLDRSVGRSANSIIRQVMEVRAVVPALHEDFSSEPIFARSRLGEPLDWTGALPPDDLVDRMERALGDGQSLRTLLGRGGHS
jgi:pilus assembly protein CpaF